MSLKGRATCLNCSMVLIFMLLLQFASAQTSFPEVDQVLDSKKQSMGGKQVALVYKDGKMVYKKEVGDDYKITSPQPIGAISKWLTAALVMTFVDKGELSLDDPVTKYIPMFGTYAKNYITVRHCLSEITGIENEPKKLSRMLQKKKFASLEEEANYYAKNKEIITNPGKEFFYGDIGYVVAGRVLEAVAKKKTFSRLMQERITRPLAMRKTSFMNDSGGEDPAGGAVSSADDLGKFLSMLLNHGELNGKRILSEKAVDEMEKIQFSALPVKYTPKLTQGFGYAYGVWISESDKNGKASVVLAPGYNGTFAYIDRCRNYAGVLFGKEVENEQSPATYMAIKEEVDQQFKSSCN